jgi:hypothetical protein
MSPLERLAARCASIPSFLAHPLAAYQRKHNLTDEALATVLGCTLDNLTRVRLCGLPRVESFAADCLLIADRFGCRAEVIEEACWPW